VLKRVLVLGALALVLGVSVRLSTIPTPAVAIPSPSGVGAVGSPLPVESGNGRSRWQPLWTQPAPDLACLAVASDGSSVVWVDARGSVRRILSSTGKTLWQTPPLPAVNQVRVGTNGAVLAFSRMNPDSPAVRILDPVAGALRSALVPVDGAVWDAALTGDGGKAVVGTGQASFYLIPMRPDAVWPGAPTKLGGIPDSLSIASGEPLALFGTWQDGGVSAWGLDRLPRWRRQEREVDRLYSVRLSADGGTAVAVSSQGPRRQNARLTVWDGRAGKLLWIEELDGSDPRVAVSANGRTIAVTYAQVSAYNSGNAVERKVALFDREGRRLFGEKGGVFFSPELVCLSADGARTTVKDAAGNIWTLDSHGRTIARLHAPTDPTTGATPTVRQIVATEGGAFLLVYRGDGNLTLYKAAAS
jgi:hypothetical protein